MDMVAGEELVTHLSSALRNLYDPVVLSRSPLVSLLVSPDHRDPPAELRRILERAIEDLKPTGDTSSRSLAWRAYDVLFYRYVQQLSAPEVADQLGLSVRHLGREQQRAFRALAHLVLLMCHGAARQEAGEGVPAESEVAGVSKDLAWLKESPVDEPGDLQQELRSVLSLLEPLVAQRGAHIDVSFDDSLPRLAVHPTALRQMLLGMVTSALHQSAGGRLCILAAPERWMVTIHIRGPRAPAADSASGPDDAANQAITRQLAELYGGSIAMSKDAHESVATLTLPACEQLLVLVIDDNADAIQLLQRYALKTRYRVVGTRSPAEALVLMEQLGPQIICLDIMMPGLDGWELLRALRAHPAATGVAIVVCTVLAQEELARTLGASGFLRKPIRHEAFLAELDRQVSAIR